MKRRWLTFAIVACVVLSLIGLAAARPGGGHSFSGGGGHSGGGGGGDGSGWAELIYWLIRLVIEVPQIGIPVVLCVIGYFVHSAYKQHANKDWDSGPPVVLERAIDLGDMHRIDPDFSQVLFEDFAFRLFSTAHRLRHSAEALAQVAPYVGADARRALQSRPPAGVPVASVVIGAMRVTRVDLPSASADSEPSGSRAKITVEFEANVTTADKTYYTVELWRFSRDATRASKPPASKGFPCPNCGAPWHSAQTGTQLCASCNEAVDNGRFDWIVELVTLRSIDARPPALLGNVQERGTDLPTYRQDDVEQQLIALGQHDPGITESALLERLRLIYDQLTLAWVANDLRPIRGLVSDGLYDYLSYWIEAYQRQDLRNELHDMRITSHAWAKVARDRWYDTVTVRIWGTGKDFTVQASTGDLLKGSPTFERAYSEYWTLIRSASRKGAPIAEPKCSNCGAPLQITMAGECEHCSAHLTAGEFDWVLSKIEQDDSYRG